MSKKRQSDLDQNQDFSRSTSRTFCRDGSWFFSSREGDMGPYDSEAEAVQEMDSYVALVDLKEENESPVTPDIFEDEEIA